MYDLEVLTRVFTSFKFEFLNLQLSLFWLSSESSPALAGGQLFVDSLFPNCSAPNGRQS